MIGSILRTGLITLIIMVTLTVFNQSRVIDWYMWVYNYLFVWFIAVLVSSALKR
jgi:hypothetical protein